MRLVGTRSKKRGCDDQNETSQRNDTFQEDQAYDLRKDPFFRGLSHCVNSLSSLKWKQAEYALCALERPSVAVSNNASLTSHDFVCVITFFLCSRFLSL